MDLREGYVICSRQMKEKLLKQLHGFHHYMFLTMEDLFFKLAYVPKKNAIFQVMKHYQISYDLACEYIKGIPYIQEQNYGDPKLDGIVSVFHYLKKMDLLEKDDLFLIRLKQNPITFINPSDSAFYQLLKEKIKQYTEIYEVYTEQKNYLPNVYELATREEEGLFVFNKIKELLRKGISLNHIYLVNTTSDFLLKRLKENYEISIDLEPSKNITSSDEYRELIDLCGKYLRFEEVFANMNKEAPLYDTFVQMINQYGLYEENPVECVGFLEKVAKTTSYPIKKYTEAVRLVSPDFVFDDEDYVFLMNAQLGRMPFQYKEDGFLNDDLLKQLGAMTSYERHQQSHDDFKRLIKNTKNLVITYHKKDQKETCLPSLLISELHLNVIKGYASLGFSKIEDDLKLSSLYDDFLKYGTMDLLLEEYGLNGINYRAYQHQYQKIDQELLNKRFENKPLKLAYSNLKLYYACPFGYYADRILGFNEFEPQMAARMGTFSHAVLEDSYEHDFSFEASVLKHKEENVKDAKDEFFFGQMEQVLRHIIDFNHQHEALSKLNEIRREEHIVVIKENCQFEGFIDKLMYFIDGDNVYAAIIDYKTGKDIVSLDNIEDGFHLQLPAYMYLLSHYEPFKNYQLHIIGIYLQKVNIVLFDTKSDIQSQMNKKFRLEGYTVGDMTLIPYLDPQFAYSDYIKSMSLTKDGFGRYAKIYPKEKQQEMIDLVDRLIEEAADHIHQGDFPISPKMINGKNESCTYCKYKDVCFYDFKDVVELSYKPFGKERDS